MTSTKDNKTKRKWYNTIRGKIITASILFATIIAIVVACVSYKFFMRSIANTQRLSVESSLQLTGSELDIAFQRVMSFANWAQIDGSLSNYLARMNSDYNKPSGHAMRSISFTTWQILNNEYISTSRGGYINRVVVMTPDGSHYLQCVPGSSRSSVINTRTDILEKPWFGELSDAHDYIWDLSMITDLEDHTPRFIPVVRPIERQTSSEIVGYIYLDVSASILTDALSGIKLDDDAALFITSDNETYSYRNGEFVKSGLPDNVFTYSLPHANLSISLLPSSALLKSQRRFYLLIAIIIFAVIFCTGILLSAFLRQTISVPVNALLKKAKRVGLGDFSNDPDIEWDNELGDIGMSLNSLSANVSALMERRVSDEKKKQELEYEILQSQINPHFLYNTLNTVKWMATIQGSEGISEIATALSRLLKNVSKNHDALIPLKEELSLVNDYFTIMKYRYGGTITLVIDIESEDLYDILVNRFSLQPIVENAIFHGIEPKGEAGTITIHAYRSDDDLIIDTTDDGIGMSCDTIKTILNGNTEEQTDFFRHVGISNVNSRIRYSFGNNYGIHIDSREGSYTTVSMKLPYVSKENKNNEL